MRSILGIISLWLLAALMGCEGKKTFAIEGRMDAAANLNMVIQYYGNYAVQRCTIGVRNGEFKGEFPTVEPAFAQILDFRGNVLGWVYARKGDVISMTIDRANPYNIKLSGTPVNEELAEALNSNAEALASGDSEKINQAVIDYIAGHPQSEASALMFAAFYDSSADAEKADSVLSLIDPAAKPASVLDAYVWQLRPFTDALAYRGVKEFRYRRQQSDSLLRFSMGDKPLTLIVFTNESSFRKDSLVHHLERMHKAHPAKELQMLELGLHTDMETWRNMTMRDSAEWIQGWVPGAMMGDVPRSLAVPSVPYYIVADSTGRQLYRGTRPEGAEEALSKHAGKQ